MVILRLPKFLFMSGRNRLWPLREIIHLPPQETVIRNSLNGRALQDISILPPDASWKVLLDTLRIKYQHKDSYDNMLSVFFGLQMTPAEDCAAFSSKLEQKLSYVQAMYADELNNKQYWHLLRERFFHGLPSKFEDQYQK